MGLSASCWNNLEFGIGKKRNQCLSLMGKQVRMVSVLHMHAASLVTQSEALMARCVCAGTACAWSLSRTPENYDVHVWEALPVPGGVASSCKVKDGKN